MDLKPGYKQTEVGLVPEDWSSPKIGDCAFVTKLAGFEYSLHFDYSKTGSVTAIRALNIQDGALNLDEVHTIPKETSDALPRSQLQRGDLVMSYVGTLGRVAVIPEDDKFHLAPNVAKISVNRAKVSPAFLSHFLNSRQGHKMISDAAASTSQAALSMRSLRGLFFACPALIEQESIAEVLNDVDALIKSLEQLLAKKRRLKQGTMHELLTGKRRIPGFDSKTGYKQTEAGVIPKDWDAEPLASICEIIAGRDLVKADYSPTESQTHPFPIYSNALTKSGLYGYSRFYQYEGERITVTARGDIGHAVYRSTRFCAIGRLLVLSPKRPCDLRFIAEFINNAVDFALESTGVPQLTAPQISSCVVALPRQAEQAAIATILSNMDAEIAALEANLAKTRQIKQGMMQELLTGRIRLA